jgi:hypothetical protein
VHHGPQIAGLACFKPELSLDHWIDFEVNLRFNGASRTPSVSGQAEFPHAALDAAFGSLQANRKPGRADLVFDGLSECSIFLGRPRRILGFHNYLIAKVIAPSFGVILQSCTKVQRSVHPRFT